MNKHFAAFFAVVSILFGLLVYFVFTYEGPLERQKIGIINVRAGALLESVVYDINLELKRNGSTWSVVLDEQIADYASRRNFGGGGNAVFLQPLAREFNCNILVLKDDEIVLLHEKKPPGSAG